MSKFTADISHPRYNSLLNRHKLEVAANKGMLANSAMIAHGRGEAFDYLLGEVTTSNAKHATTQTTVSTFTSGSFIMTITLPSLDTGRHDAPRPEP